MKKKKKERQVFAVFEMYLGVMVFVPFSFY